MLTRIQVFCLLLIAPFIGFFLAYTQFTPLKNTDVESLFFVQEKVQNQTLIVGENIGNTREMITETRNVAETSNELVGLIQQSAYQELIEYEQQKEIMDLLVEASVTQGQMSAGVLDTLLANMLGDPIGQTFGEKALVKVYSLEEAGYRGYMAKVRLHNPNALKMVLANDQVRSSGETTSAAAKRSGAVLAVNAGGFQSSNGQLSPLGITVIDGEIVTFSNSDLSFVGFNKQGNLVGGSISSQEQIGEMGISQGASFLPTLLKDGKKQSIPSAWANTRHPRTLIGHFKNGDLLFIVIDGRRKGWSSGVTLEEAQEKLLEFNVRDAYNLDGGGSSTFYYKGKVLNKPSGESERPVTTNLVIVP